MHALDIAIIAVYLALMVAVGWLVARLASRTSESYFLAGKSLPWWVIGVAHGSSGVDITGTMWFVMMLFAYGVKGVWLLWVWPLFNVVFRMVYLGAWVRRSNVLTGAEWMRTRFGESRGAELAYLSVVVYALVSVVGFLSYAFRGIGEFAVPFFPWDLDLGSLTLGLGSWRVLDVHLGPAEVYGTAILLVTGIYCVVGGMYSVVLNDLIQFALIVVAAVAIAWVAMAGAGPGEIAARVPEGWSDLFPGSKLDLDWASKGLPALEKKLYAPVSGGGDGYSLFGLFLGMLFLKGVLVSMAGPTPNYAIQHVLSTRSPREAALENLVMAVVSLAPRFLFIAGVTAIGIAHYMPQLRGMGEKVNFELILPAVVNEHLPVGLRGVVLAGLLAAFMSTFVSTVNSGAAYVVNDIYKRYVDPQAPQRRLVRIAYATSAAVIAAGILFGFVTKSVHNVTEWIVSALVPAFVAPNVLKWHWWRFNGWGFFAGMAAGTAAALAIPQVFGKIHPVWLFLSVLALSGVASVAACLLTAPEDGPVTERFYRTVRPWGFWKPVYERCRAATPGFERNRDFPRDAFNVAVGIAWQIAMVALPIYVVIEEWTKALVSLAVFAGTSAVLKFTWYDRLGPGEMYLDDRR
ncbi:MAG: sodium:solute symporter family transporter [Planctomycetota bacterium]